MLKYFIALQTRYMELRDNERGQAYVEYGILLALVAIALIATLVFFSGEIDKAFDKIADKVDGS
jgi:Flp pilus assembly pilin Flp